MKRNLLVSAGMALLLAFCLDKVGAQSDVPPPGSVPSAPGQPPIVRQPLPRLRGPRPFIARAMGDLRMVKMELQRSPDDFGGHKKSAIEACDKAMQELDAVMKAIPQGPSPQRSVQPAGGTGVTPPPVQPPASQAPAGRPAQP